MIPGGVEHEATALEQPTVIVGILLRRALNRSFRRWTAVDAGVSIHTGNPSRWVGENNRLLPSLQI